MNVSGNGLGSERITHGGTPQWTGGKASATTAGDTEIEPRFPGRVMPVAWKDGTLVAILRASGVTGPVLGLVGPMSLCRDRVS